MDAFPDDILGELLLQLEDVHDVIHWMRISSKFYKYAIAHLVQIDSSRYIEIPIVWLSRFKRLVKIGELIRILIRPEEVKLISELLKLDQMNIKLTGGSAVAQPFAISDLLKSVKGRSPLNLRMIVGSHALIIQGGRFSTFGSGELSLYIKRALPDLKEVELPMIDYGYMGESPVEIINRRFFSFLQQAEFGLGDPREPPSQKNYSMTPLVRELGKTGAIDSGLLLRIYYLYGEYHRINEGTIFWPDHLLKDCFGSIIERARLNLSPEERSDWPYKGRWYSEQADMIRDEMTIPRDETLHEFDLPEPLSSERYYFCLKKIWSAERKYHTQCRAGYDRKDPFYREDGTISQWQPN
jgi:hypothetical protein